MSIADAQIIVRACQDMHTVLTNQSPLHKEAAILSRLVYKYDKKFRNDIGYKNFKKVNTALHKNLQLNFLKDVEQFQLVLPSEDADDDIYLPSRQMLEYLLVRLLTFSKIILRIYICSKCAATFYLDRIKRGESHWMSLIPYAVLSRTWSMSWVLIRHSCKWYKSLILYQSKLQSKGLRFLPENYKLPEDLEEWLDLDNIDDFGRHNWSEVKSITVIPLLEEVDEQTSFDIFNYVSDINSDNQAEIEAKIAELQGDLDNKTWHRKNLSKATGLSNNKAEDSGEDVKKNECKEKKLPKTLTQLPNQKQDLGQAISRTSFNIDKNKAEPEKLKPQENPKAQSKMFSKKEDLGQIPRESLPNNIEIKTAHSEKVKPQESFKSHSKMLNKDLDLGQVISRESLNIEKTKAETDNPKPTENSKVHATFSITDSQTLTQFLNTEETCRNEDNDKSLTNHLSFMQWQALKNNLLQLCDSKANNRKVQRKFQKIWKQKCLAYLE